MLIALDRMERGGDAEHRGATPRCRRSARFGIPVLSIASLTDLLGYLEAESAGAGEHASYRDAIARYRHRYGVAPD